MAKKFIDDKMVHLESDVDKIRLKPMMYISHVGDAAALSCTFEILFNAIDECINPRSPADTIEIEFDEESGTILIRDNGRGIPTDKLELLLTTLNSGSNIDSGAKSDLKTGTLGRNGVGTIAYQALAERLVVTSYRGGTENSWLRLVFEEGKKVNESKGKCPETKHGLEVSFKPSKILGRKTKIQWKDVHETLFNLQFLLKKKIKMISKYRNLNGNIIEEKYKVQHFSELLKAKINKENIISPIVTINIKDDNVEEEVIEKKYKRFIDMDISFVYTNLTSPYINSFCNQNNTIDNGNHLDGTIEAINRFFQNTIKQSMSDKERERIDIKWEDIQNGLAVVVNLNTNMENLFTGQTKHKITNEDLGKNIKILAQDALKDYFEKNQSDFKIISNLIKVNARARREGEKLKESSIKERLTNWSSFKMKNYDPCINKGKAYKELFIIEGDSAKGSLLHARNPQFQALYAIRGVSLNVFKAEIHKIVKNTEFADLIKVMGCGSGLAFDLSKLQFDKIIIASDADVDGLNIRSLLCSFFIKMFPEIVEDGRLFIAEPPLYRVKDKKDPFVINQADYINRYVIAASKDYDIGFYDSSNDTHQYMNKEELREFLKETSFYLDIIEGNADHYRINERLLEIIYAYLGFLSRSLNDLSDDNKLLQSIDYDMLMKMIVEFFPELTYSYEKNLIRGSINGKYQTLEINERLIRKGKEIINIYNKYNLDMIILRSKRGDNEILKLSPMESLKVLRKYQPDIVHRFKGLGENNAEDLAITVMDPNTRTLIKCTTSNLENDMKLFQILRGGSIEDASARKEMIKDYQNRATYRELKEQIDT